MKYASVDGQMGQSAKVRSTFSQASEPPKMSSTCFFCTGIGVRIFFLMLHTYGHVVQKKRRPEDADSTSSRLPHGGQNCISAVRCARNSSGSGADPRTCYMRLRRNGKLGAKAHIPRAFKKPAKTERARYGSADRLEEIQRAAFQF
eukprot:scaffold1503_cov250-Pinguiococcus_pyrenoidosus.AAC.10